MIRTAFEMSKAIPEFNNYKEDVKTINKHLGWQINNGDKNEKVNGFC